MRLAFYGLNAISSKFNLKSIRESLLLGTGSGMSRFAVRRVGSGHSRGKEEAQAKLFKVD